MSTLKTDTLNISGFDVKVAEVELSNSTLSGASTLDLSLGGSGFGMHVLEWYGVTVSSDGAVMQVLTSTDGGGSFDTSAGSYEGVVFDQTWTNTRTPATGQTSYINLTRQGIGNHGNEQPCNGELRIIGAQDAKWTHFMFHNAHHQTIADGDVGVHVIGGFVRKSTNIVSNIRVKMSAGTFSGNFRLWGLKDGL